MQAYASFSGRLEETYAQAMRLAETLQNLQSGLALENDASLPIASRLLQVCISYLPEDVLLHSAEERKKLLGVR